MSPRMSTSSVPCTWESPLAACYSDGVSRVYTAQNARDSYTSSIVSLLCSSVGRSGKGYLRREPDVIVCRFFGEQTTNFPGKINRSVAKKREVLFSVIIRWNPSMTPINNNKKYFLWKLWNDDLFNFLFNVLCLPTFVFPFPLCL